MNQYDWGELLKMKGELFYKGIIRQEDGYFIIRQSIPYPLAENNVFLIESNRGWTVIDVGIDLPPTRDVWEMAVKEVGISFKQIDQIYITHCHPDHLGAARWLQKVCDAPVFIPRKEIMRAQEFIFIEEDFPAVYRRAIEPEANRHGFPADILEQLIIDWQDQVTPLFKKPYEIFPLDEGAEIGLGADKFQVSLLPGHADGQVMLFDQRSGRLFCADMLSEAAYLHFTDWPNTHLNNPLGSLFNSMDQLESLEVSKVYPGHGPCFQNLPELLLSLREKHLRRLEKVLRAVREPITAGDLYPQLYAATDYVHHHRLLLGETLGYLEFLASDGQLRRIDDGEKVRFAGN